MENTNPSGQQPAPAAEKARSKTGVVAVVLLAAVAAVVYFVLGSSTPNPMPEPVGVTPPAAQESQGPGVADANAVAQDLTNALPTDTASDMGQIDAELAK